VARGDESCEEPPGQTRARLLARAGRAVVALSAAGVLLTEADAIPAAPVGDRGVLRMLAAGERLAIALYERAAALPGLPPHVGVWIEGAVSNEREHLRVLSGSAPGLTLGAVRLAPGAVATLPAALALAARVEAALLGAYLGAVTGLSSPELQASAAAIAANEAQHLAAVERIAAGRLVSSPPVARGSSPSGTRAALAAAGAPVVDP
jgi:hypothetical protein